MFAQLFASLKNAIIQLKNDFLGNQNTDRLLEETLEKAEQIANQFSTLCTRLDNLETIGEKMALQQQPDEETGQRTAAELDHLNRNKKDRSNTISQLEQKRMEQESKLRDYREKTQDLAAQKEDVETRLRELDSRSASFGCQG